jgi:bifunctional DNA-binding transcriptional regulator/antitoxin component of YhaV-PrlF toxin-antitoxin module
MLVTNNIIKALKGNESLLLILPKEAGIELGIANHDWLKYEIKDSEIIIRKIDFGCREFLPITTGGQDLF